MQKKWQFLFSLAFGAIWMLCLYFTFDATLSLTQLHLSDGMTAYSPLVGSLVLTGLLLLLQRLVQRFTRFRQSCFLLTFFPSTAALVLLTSFVSGVSLFAVIVTSVLAFAWYVMAVMESFRHENVVVRPLKAASWFGQILLFFLLVFYMGAMGNSKDVYRYEVQTARLLRAGHYLKLWKWEKHLWLPRSISRRCVLMPWEKSQKVWETNCFIFLCRKTAVAVRCCCCRQTVCPYSFRPTVSTVCSVFPRMMASSLRPIIWL